MEFQNFHFPAEIVIFEEKIMEIISRVNSLILQIQPTYDFHKNSHDKNGRFQEIRENHI